MTSDENASESIFECRMCGDCCKGYGGTYVSETDIAAIAAYLDIDSNAFISRYCKRSGSKHLLAQQPNGYCIFWDKLCRIHPVKPRMCRQWPYIRSVLVDIGNWKAMASMCPGIRKDAPPELVRSTVMRMLNSPASGSTRSA